MKLVVNTLLGVGMQAIAEAVALGQGLDLPRELLFDVLSKTAVVARPTRESWRLPWGTTTHRNFPFV